MYPCNLISLQPWTSNVSQWPGSFLTITCIPGKVHYSFLMWNEETWLRTIFDVIVTVCWNLKWVHEKSLLKDKKSTHDILSYYQTFKGGLLMRNVLHLKSSLSKTLPKYQLHLGATCKDHCKCSNLNGCHHSIPFQPDLKKGIQDQSGITKAMKQMNVQFHLKMLWGRKIWGKVSWWNYI